MHLLYCNISVTERDESSTDAATAIYFICILLQPFGCDVTFCLGSCGRIHVRSQPKALLKIDERKIRQTKFVASSTHGAYDTVSGCLRVRPPCAFAARAYVCMCKTASQCDRGPLCWACSVFNNPSTPFRKREGERDRACPNKLQ